MSGSLLPQGQGRLRLPEEERARSSQLSAGPRGCWPGCTGPGEHQARQHGASGRRMETLSVCVWTCSPGQDGASSLASRGPQRHLIGTVTAPRPLPPAAFHARQRRGPSGGPLPRTPTACTAVGPLRLLRMTCPPPAPALSPSTQQGGQGSLGPPKLTVSLCWGCPLPHTGFPTRGLEPTWHLRENRKRPRLPRVLPRSRSNTNPDACAQPLSVPAPVTRSRPEPPGLTASAAKPPPAAPSIRTRPSPPGPHPPLETTAPAARRDEHVLPRARERRRSSQPPTRQDVPTATAASDNTLDPWT